MSAETQSLQRQADRVRIGGKPSVLGYLVVLFAVAFVLLLLALFMQERSGEEGFRPYISSEQSTQDAAQQALQEQLDLLRLLERLEFLVSTDQTEAAVQLWNPALETVLPVLDDPGQGSGEHSSSGYAPGQPTVTERVQALKAVLFPNEY